MNLSNAEKNRAMCDALLDKYDIDYVISSLWSRVITTDSELEMSMILNYLSEFVEFTTEYIFSNSVAYEITLPRIMIIGFSEYCESDSQVKQFVMYK